MHLCVSFRNVKSRNPLEESRRRQIGSALVCSSVAAARRIRSNAERDFDGLRWCRLKTWLKIVGNDENVVVGEV